LGQPNWLAAWLTALLPLTWAFSSDPNIKNQKLNIKFLFWVLLSSLFFLTILFTKSRSGLLGFGTASLIFWTLYLLISLKAKKGFDFLHVFLIFNISFLILTVLVGTPWTPSVSQFLNHKISINNLSAQAGDQLETAGPALEVGGTESGTIRKIVWEGALEIWKHYPILGSGVETFAYSYYNFRPAEHNLISEWDFLYNKAHNEYLNLAANSGSVGLISYLTLVAISIVVFLK